MNDFFLWPDPDPLAPSDIVGPRCSSESVESQLRDLYPCAEPVLFSSARAGLSAALLAMGLGRPDMCWTPPFSSHCVLEAVALACTPAPVEVDALRAALVYHQWGYVAGSPFGPDVRLIEDAVDSLLLPGRSPFALGGECVLWSLPKVLRVQGGGVVFCRSADLAGKLRAVRARRTHSWLHACLRLKAKSSPLAARYWNGAEAMQGELPAPMPVPAVAPIAAPTPAPCELPTAAPRTAPSAVPSSAEPTAALLAASAWPATCVCAYCLHSSWSFWKIGNGIVAPGMTGMVGPIGVLAHEHSRTDALSTESDTLQRWFMTILIGCR